MLAFFWAQVGSDYVGDPIDFQLVDPTKRMFSPQRNYTAEELQFGDEKIQEMLNASVIKEIPTTNPHSSCITLPMKRAPDGYRQAFLH